MSADANRQAQGHHGLALGWLKRGRVKSAIVSLERALATDPTYLEAQLELARVLLQLRRWRDLAAHCRRAFGHFTEVPEFHKLLITALEELGSLEDAEAHYDLKRRDHRPLEIRADEILCCLAARNERPRLSYFLHYYRQLGVDRFFVIDNASSDGSLEWLLEQPDVHVYSSALSFKRANFGASWFELLLRRHGIGHWCLTVDADEFLIYEGSPRRSLRDFCRDLERRGKEAATGMLLDLYSDQPLGQTRYHEGEDPRALCSFFDRRVYHRSYEQGGTYRNQTIFFGGVRQRIFPAEHDYLLSKCVLLRYRPDVVLTSGQHLTNLAAPLLAQQQICLLHFKFFASLFSYARDEAAREIHAGGAEQYKAYHRELQQNPDLMLYDPAHSIRFEGTAQLRELGVMLPEEPLAPPSIPVIEPVRSGESDASNRPFWSVMITIYDRVQNVERVLQSVLRQADAEMQIEVICDLSDPEQQAAIGARVAELGGERVTFHALPQRLGHPHVFNHCIERARGQWIHILHDDDWVEPGFYQSLREGIAANPQAGAAFCQHTIVAKSRGEQALWRSWVERETPGLLEPSDWLARIALECRVQFSAMTVRRDVYETLGGFCADALSAFDWEMWTRIAARHPVYYLPEALVGVGRDETAESSRLLRSGEQVAHAFKAIAVAAQTLPAEDAARLVPKARERIAGYALDVARRYLGSGDLAAALANLRAAVAVTPSARTLRQLTELLQGEDHEYRG